MITSFSTDAELDGHLSRGAIHEKAPLTAAKSTLGIVGETDLRSLDVFYNPFSTSGPSCFPASSPGGRLFFNIFGTRQDFVSVRDIAQACLLALEVPEAADQIFNVGSGCDCTIRKIAGQMARVLSKEHIEPEIVGKCRVGDIRKCFADISLSREVLGYELRVSLAADLGKLAEWLEGQTPVDRVADASQELQKRGLAV